LHKNLLSALQLQQGWHAKLKMFISSANAVSQNHILVHLQGSHPLVEADEAANPLTATASAADSVPGAGTGLSADSASEVMRAALAAEAEEVEELAQKV
jgi:hypothetical protein